MAEEVNTNTNIEQERASQPETEKDTGGFKPIESQDALDAIIKDRLDRKEASVRKEYEGYIKPDDYQTKLDALKEAQKKIRDYETSSAKKGIAEEFGLPAELADRIAGKDEKEWRKDAESLSHLFKSAYPGKSTLNVDKTENGGLNEMLRQLRGA